MARKDEKFKNVDKSDVRKSRLSENLGDKQPKLTESLSRLMESFPSEMADSDDTSRHSRVKRIVDKENSRTVKSEDNKVEKKRAVNADSLESKSADGRVNSERSLESSDVDYPDDEEDESARLSNENRDSRKAFLRAGGQMERFADQEERMSLYDDFEAKDVVKRGAIIKAEDYEEVENADRDLADDLSSLREFDPPEEEDEEGEEQDENVSKGDVRVKRDESQKSSNKKDDAQSEESSKSVANENSNENVEEAEKKRVGGNTNENANSRKEDLGESREKEAVKEQLQETSSSNKGAATDEEKAPLDLSKSSSSSSSGEDKVSGKNTIDNSDAEYDKKIQERIQKRIDSIKEEIKREIEERRKIQEIEANNAKFDELEGHVDEDDDNSNSKADLSKSDDSDKNSSPARIKRSNEDSAERLEKETEEKSYNPASQDLSNFERESESKKSENTNGLDKEQSESISSVNEKSGLARKSDLNEEKGESEKLVNNSELVAILGDSKNDQERTKTVEENGVERERDKVKEESGANKKGDEINEETDNETDRLKVQEAPGIRENFQLREDGPIDSIQQDCSLTNDGKTRLKREALRDSQDDNIGRQESNEEENSQRRAKRQIKRNVRRLNERNLDNGKSRRRSVPERFRRTSNHLAKVPIKKREQPRQAYLVNNGDRRKRRR
ncbi:protein starmaker-like, partial [Prorops nasuta]|uniref:protein starmaker-like n=1 Tax=Prorops nasuta TaxID=863751 RepID=UPI0034CEED09